MEEDCSASVVKGKRTKRRQRTPQLLFLSQEEAAPSSASSAEFSGTVTEEEEDMANCLILLAQGPSCRESPMAFKPEEPAVVKFTSRRFTEAATTSGKAGFFVYECKTCSKCFSSFQALGGHRASHKKPRLSIPATVTMMDEDSIQLSMSSFSSPAGGGAGKARVHECAICGAEFTSGQALGGHMRRHRPTSTPEPFYPRLDAKKNGLCLDLNLPAPAEDDHRSANNLPASSSSAPVASSAFPFAGKQPLLLCHY